LSFLLSSILLVTYKTKRDGPINDRNNSDIINTNKKKNVVLLSGHIFGIGYLYQIPIFTMVPLVAYLIFTNNIPKDFKTLGIWFIPVIMIPLIWPA
jgi:4-amino-4-deoxy-L-arabinose transferase-like glycosyltransferase